MNNLTLLVIDDEPLIGDFVCDTAKQVGFNTLYFNNGQTLIDSKDTDQIEIIILDLMMPEIDGIEMIRYIARNMPKVSIILMSGVDTSILHSAQNWPWSMGSIFWVFYKSLFTLPAYAKFYWTGRKTIPVFSHMIAHRQIIQILNLQNYLMQSIPIN